MRKRTTNNGTEVVKYYEENTCEEGSKCQKYKKGVRIFLFFWLTS